MTKGCAVPKCKTGYRSSKQKCSVFRVPRNDEQYKKWLHAIPGLKQSQHVCEKHFEERFILRHWRKEDENGRIIAESPYAHPKLSEFAVPTIFEENVHVVQKSTGFAINKCAEQQIDKVLCPITVRKFPDESTMVPSPIDAMNADCAENKLDEGLSPELYIKQEDDSSQSSPTIEMEITPEEKFIPPPESFRQIIYFPNKLAGYEVSPSAATVLTKTESASVNKTQYEISDTTLNVHSTKVTENRESSRETTSITIPKLWTITQSSTIEQRIIFAYVVTQKDNAVDVPVIAKSVTLDPRKSLRYFIYGRALNPEQCELKMMLNDVTLLPGILQKFKNINICDGLGAINVLHLPANDTYQDAAGRWHQNDCPLVSKLKRCEQCRKMRQRVLKKEKRSNENRPVLRVYRVSNPMDEQKLLALRKKSYRERRLKNRAKQRAQLLRQCLSAKADEIASLRVETIEQRKL